MAHLAFTEGDIEWGDHLTENEYPGPLANEAAASDVDGESGSQRHPRPEGAHAGTPGR